MHRRRQRLERPPGDGGGGVSCARARRGVLAARIRRLSARDAGARREKHRRAGEELRARPAGDARRDHSGDARGVHRQPEQSHGHVCPGRRARGFSRAHAARRRGRDRRGLHRVSAARAALRQRGLAEEISEPRSHAHFFEGIRPRGAEGGLRTYASARGRPLQSRAPAFQRSQPCARRRDRGASRQEVRREESQHEPDRHGAPGARLQEARARIHSFVRQLRELLRAAARRQAARGQGVREAAAAGDHRAAGGGLRHARSPARHGRHAETERKIPQGAGCGAGGVMARIEKLVVVGVGLIGGSFALALKEAGAVSRAVGVGRSAQNIRRALELKIIDAAGALDAATLADADLVLLAVPVGQMQPVMRAIAPFLGAKTVVTDAGSTKQDVVELARRELRGSLSRFVPGHPIAGTEKSGAEAAFAGLYRGRKVVLTPLKNNDPGAIALVRSSWESCGASVFEMKPKEHDAVLATVSHLPHLLAYALVDQVARDKDAERLFSYAAGGFRDFTRIASSHPEMWRDICLANREALLADLKRYGKGLDKLRSVLKRGDAKALQALFSGAREARERWLKDAQ